MHLHTSDKIRVLHSEYSTSTKYVIALLTHQNWVIRPDQVRLLTETFRTGRRADPKQDRRA